MSEPRIVALIPARAGSKRVPHKNVRELAGHSLLAYAIGAAREAGIFSHIGVSSDDTKVLDTASRYGAEPIERSAAFAKDDSPDIEWVTEALLTEPPLEWLHPWGDARKVDAFCILRPTSPFRRGPWIRKAWEILQSAPRADSIRAVRPCLEHPAKMWREQNPFYRIEGARWSDAPRYVAPVMAGIGYEAPWHSMPTQLLPTVFTQTAALEIAWTRVLPGSISGAMVLPYFTEADSPEAIDINTENDWIDVEALARVHPEYLPHVERK